MNKFLRLIVAAILTVLNTGVQIHAQFTINGVKPCYDEETKTFLFSVDKQIWDKSWLAEVKLTDDSPWQDISINGQQVSGLFDFSHVDGQTKYLISATGEGGVINSILCFTYMPIIHIEGTVGMEYRDGSVELQHEGRISEGMPTKIKWRGGTTNAPDKHKRNYKIKFFDISGAKENVSFFDLRTDNTWILDAGQVDMFRMRNYVAANIWNDFAAKPYYIELEPQALTATRSEMIELFLNKSYQGIYHLCEPIDRKQMKLKKFDSDGTIHGGLWKATSHGDATFWNYPADYDNTKEVNDVWELKYPKIEDLCPSDYTTLRNAIVFVKTSSDQDFCENVTAYFDMPVMIDYYLFVALTNGFDICGKNIYWAVYDKQRDKRLTPAMWDLDCTMGQNFTDDPLHPDYVGYNYPIREPNNIFHRLIALDTDGFNQRIRNRYAELRQGVFKPENLKQRYARAYTVVHDCGADLREEQRWSYDSDISGLQLDFAEELDYICDWIDHRIAFLDEAFSYEGHTGIKQVKHISNDDRAYSIVGLPVDKNTYLGVMIVDGKIIVNHKR